LGSMYTRYEIFQRPPGTDKKPGSDKIKT
jgi:hypothetical protein